jgi:uncharacterized protein
MDVFTHPIAQKYLQRSGVAHAIACAYHAYRLSVKADISPDLATKAALLHDIGHYEWYTDGKWDYEKYRRNDIHAIKGDSYLPEGELDKNTLQQIVKKADELDEEPGGHHHYRQIDEAIALKKIEKLDRLIDQAQSSIKKPV